MGATFWKAIYTKLLTSGGIEWFDGRIKTNGSGSPEGVVTATVGSEYTDTSSGILWQKRSGSGNTGWLPGDFSGFANGTQGAPGAYFASETDVGWYYDNPEVILVGDNSPLFAVSKTSGQIRSAINSTVGTDYLALYNAYMCRAWVNFNGEGTIAIRASGNVSSLTDNGTGNYTLNLSVALPDTDYNAVFGGKPNSGASNDLSVSEDRDTARTVSALTVKCRDLSAGDTDPNIVSVSIFR